MSKPLIFDIHGFSLDDGPGIRTTVFLKGCPLSCIWCHNPESWSPKVQIAFYPELCIGCGECVTACPAEATAMSLRDRINRERCTCCGNCAAICPPTALKIVGNYYPPDELAERLLKNRSFYQTSGGGVTFSGGEPTLHVSYLEDVMRYLKAEGIHIVVQTSGMFDLDIFISNLLPLKFLVLSLKFQVFSKKFPGKNALIL
ncbi:MAG: glycyl-radical enzyme activating protein [Nitrospirae bacterium]|nr:glycyl-radical enzyme activating protein [Nitrospirota bacterium]